MKHSAQLKVRFCGHCWKEKSVACLCSVAFLTILFSVKTNYELEAALIPGNLPKEFVLDLLPSSDDGRFYFAVSHRVE